MNTIVPHYKRIENEKSQKLLYDFIDEINDNLLLLEEEDEEKVVEVLLFLLTGKKKEEIKRLLKKFTKIIVKQHSSLFI